MDKKESKNILKVIGIVLIILIIIGVAASFIINMSGGSKRSEKAVVKLIDAITSKGDMEEFMTTYLDFDGVAAWQRVDGDVNKFDEEYSKIKTNQKGKEAIKEILLDLITETKENNREIKLLGVSDLLKNVNNKKISTISVQLKYKNADEENWKKEDVDITFYNNKVIDIATILEDKSIISIFDDFDKEEINIKTTGYYVYKMTDSYWEMKFDEDGKVTYLANFCPGMGCGGYTMDGTYEIKRNKITVIMTHETGDVEPRKELDEPLTWQFKIVSEDKLEMDDKEFIYYKDFQ